MSGRPLLIDLFCKAGGAGMGYHRAGFEVIGVDIEPQPNYPFRFEQADALDWLREELTLAPELRAAAYHASPPCQSHSTLRALSPHKSYPDHIAETRALLRALGRPYIIENVVGAPLIEPLLLCGAMFPGLRVYRHRLFESNVALVAPAHPRHVAKVFTHDRRKAHFGQPMTDKMFVQVTGGGNASVAEKRRAMGIDWMTGHEGQSGDSAGVHRIPRGNCSRISSNPVPPNPTPPDSPVTEPLKQTDSPEMETNATQETAPTITQQEFNRLETIEWAEEHFGSLVTNRQFPLREMKRLVARGLAQSVGLVEMCDGDGGAITPSRCREGFKMTAAGRAALELHRAAEVPTHV